MWRGGVHGNGNRADLHRPDERGDELRPVWQQDRDALLRKHPAVAQRVACPIDQRLQGGVADVAPLEAQGWSVAAPLLNVAVHERDSHVEYAARRTAGQLEHAPRLQCAGFEMSRSIGHELPAVLQPLLRGGLAAVLRR